MEIHVGSFDFARKFTADVPWIAIQISSQENWPILEQKNLLGRLQLLFHDIDRLTVDVPANWVIFNSAHATTILDFVESHPRAQALLVHCEVGVARSPAVAAALTKIAGGDDQSFFDRFIPNMRVYRGLLQIHQRRLLANGSD